MQNNDQKQSPSQLLWSQSQLVQLQLCKENSVQMEQGAEQLAAQACNVAALKAEINSLKNKLSEFDSGLFIVTAIGMLKAGKSTLVNLLARSGLASPTGFGFDTTLRPALIMQASNSKGLLQIWFQSDDNNDCVESSLDEVFAVIRGTRAQTSRAYCSECPLTDENLKNALCRKQQEAPGNMLPKEPLLVVVKVPPVQDALLSDKIAILDTPGLDSGISEWNQNKDNCNRWILRRSDLILFLQSSVAPLNETAAAILREIKKNDRSAPIWLVHNVMESKHWLKKETIELESRTQQEMANAIFKNTVGGAFSSFQANLGKAHTAILNAETVSHDLGQQLLNESSFGSLESSIRKSLNASAGKIRKQNCCQQALESVNTICNVLKCLLNEVNEQRCRTEQEKMDIRNMLSLFREYKNRKSILVCPFSADKIVINCRNWRDLESWKRKLMDMINADIDSEKSYTAKDINQIIDKSANQLADDIRKMVNSVGEGDISLNTAGDGKAAANITGKLLDIFRDYLKCIPEQDNSEMLKQYIERCNNNFVLGNFRDNLDLGLSSGNLPDLKYLRDEKDWFIFSKKYDANTAKKTIENSIQDPLETFFNDCEKKLHEAVLRWINQTALSQLMYNFERELERYVSEQCQRAEEKIEKLKKNSDDIETLKNQSCNDLQLSLERIRQENE